jgi:hypothetical protein
MIINTFNIMMIINTLNIMVDIITLNIIFKKKNYNNKKC